MSLRTKFTLLVSFLIIAVIGTNTLLVLMQSSTELRGDILRGSLRFAQLISTDILDTYQETEKTKSFVKLPGQLRSFLDLNADITNVQVVGYEGDVRYNLEEDKSENTPKEGRKIADAPQLARIQANDPSVENMHGEIAFVKQTEGGRLNFVDQAGKTLENFGEDAEMKTVVYPMKVDGASYALIYAISYATLAQRTMDVTMNALMVSIVYIVLGILVTFIFTTGIVRPLKKLTASAVNISRGRFGQVVNISTRDEVGQLSKSFNKMSLELKAATDQLVQKERLAKEIELASKIQDEFLPKKMPTLGNLDIQAGVIAADAVGGDCYDFIPLDDERLLFYIGDVTGHGVSAGLVTAIANSLIYSMATEERDINIEELTLTLNRVMRAKTRPDMFITLFIGILDTKKKTLTYAPCGHEPTFVYNTRTKQSRMLKKEGIALGMVDKVQKILKEETITLDDNDVLVLYTDGIPEAWNSERKMYTIDRLVESIEKHAGKMKSKEIYDGILEDVYRFMEGVPQADDVSLMVIKKREDQ
ncbi:hypothetical protein COW46_04060 [Candidatus Gracilibacteria bacterium CG17_big_fil_post_rev_8_21_14_2_50_48_13]|nr:MAG: hypothetical protein COW46_04060 [Candidatus Gracilibacteria bacterium CG17_big_fil_post_rev_8_21_14_2_50_48_13]